MKISSRLLLALVPTVIGIMVLYAVWAVRQRESLLLEQTEADARVFSSAVSVAFAHAFRDLQYQDAREILAEIDDEPTIYGVVFYDPDGNPTIRSETIRPEEVAPRQTVRQAPEAGAPLVLDREVGGNGSNPYFGSCRAGTEP